MNLKEIIKEKKPNLSENSLNTYVSVLTNMHKKIFIGKEFSIEDFADAQYVLANMVEMTPTTRKTKLSAIKTIMEQPLYDEQMAKDTEETKKTTMKQEKTEKDIANAVEQDEIQKLYDELKFEADHLYKKDHHTIPELQQIQSFIIIAIYHLIPPRRSLDYTAFKLKDIDKNVDNYMEKDEFVFNTYKTAKTYKEQRVKIPVQLKNIIKKWEKVNPTNFLLFDNNMNTLSSPKMTQRLNALFKGRKVSINSLRHSFLESKFADTIQINKDIINTMTTMGSSAAALPFYVKENMVTEAVQAIEHSEELIEQLVQAEQSVFEQIKEQSPEFVKAVIEESRKPIKKRVRKTPNFIVILQDSIMPAGVIS